MKISVVAPLYKCAPYIEPLCRRCVDSIRSLGEVDYEIILVNDASPDNDAEVAKTVAKRDPNVTLIDLARNSGQHRAIMVGLQKATGDLVFVIDSDLEDEPEWVVRFYEEMRRTGCDVVYGVQSQVKKRGLLYRLGRSAFFKVMRLLSGSRFRENALNARLMSRRYVDAVLTFKEREIFIDGIFEMCGFSQLPVSVAKYERSPTNYTFGRLVAMAITGITSFSTRPLIAIAVAGVVMCLLAFIYTAVIIVDKLAFGVPVEGWSSTMAAILIIGGMNIFCSGIIAVYLAKIFYEVKQRPLAVVKEIYNAGAAKKQDRAPSVSKAAAEFPEGVYSQRQTKEWHGQLVSNRADA